MALRDSYVLAIKRIPDVFQRIRDGQAPERFTNQMLKDWGFTSTNDRRFIPLLKDLGFLSAEGQPTQRYHDYRDHSRSKKVMADALREAYGDLFLIKQVPSNSDETAIEGKFKSFHNVSDNVASLMTKTFLALLPLADLTATAAIHAPKQSDQSTKVPEVTPTNKEPNATTSLHYNIQVHLPATKDIEVYNAIFKSLKEHLF